MASLIEAEWRIYASVNYTNIGSDKGLSPVQPKAHRPYHEDSDEFIFKIVYTTQMKYLSNYHSLPVI